MGTTTRLQRSKTQWQKRMIQEHLKQKLTRYGGKKVRRAKLITGVVSLRKYGLVINKK